MFKVILYFKLLFEHLVLLVTIKLMKVETISTKSAEVMREITVRVLTGAIIHECFLIRSLEEQTATESGRIQASRPEREREIRSRRTNMTNRMGVKPCKRCFIISNIV